MRLLPYSSVILECYAFCMNCSWRTSRNKDAQKLGKVHALDSKHQVIIQIEKFYQYDGRK